MARGLRAVLETLSAFGAVFVLQLLASTAGLGTAAFALALPLAANAWTLVTSVYAHLGLAHLLTNAVVLAVVGPPVARRTSRARFHAFFLVTGSLSGVAAVVLGGLLGSPVAVLGASGAILALVGYLLAGNLATERLLGRVRLSRRAWAVVVGALAVAVVVLTGGPGVAISAHVAGFLLGLVAGRLHLLRAD